MKRIKSAISIIICSMLFIITPIMSYAEEPEGDPGTGNMSVEMTKDLNDTGAAAKYDKDATMSVYLYLESAKTWDEAGDFGCNLYFSPTDQSNHKEYYAVIKPEKVYNATHYENNFVKDYYYLPKGKWEFQANTLQNFPTPDVSIFCYQSEVNTEKGKVYKIHVLMGSTDWVNNNKTKLIPAEYQSMGKNLLDDKNINNSSSNTPSTTYFDKYGLMDAALANDYDKFDNSVKDDSKVRIYMDLSKPVYVSGKYYKIWNSKMEWGEPKDKNSYKENFKSIARKEIKKSKGNDPICLDDQFKQFCKDKNIKLSNSTPKKSDIKAEKTKSKSFPLVGIIVTIGTIIYLIIKIRIER